MLRVSCGGGVMSIKLLLVCKYEIFGKGLAKLLSDDGDIELISVCHTGLEAFESTRYHPPDVILIDTESSPDGGVEIAHRIHEMLPNAGIIMLGDGKSETCFFSAIDVGARAYLSKEVSLQNLVHAVTLVADGEFVVSPPMAAKLLEEFNFLEKHKDTTMSLEKVHLSKQEQAVLALVAQGLKNKEIATDLFISVHTVKVHLRNIMEKLHAHTRQQAVTLAKEIPSMER